MPGAAKKLQLKPSLEIENISVLLAIRLGALKCAKGTGPGGPEKSQASAPSREGYERELPKFRPVGDHLSARSGARDLVPEPRAEGPVERNHLQPIAERR